MHPDPKASPASTPHEPHTLGALLYGGGPSSPPAEDEWRALVRAIAAGDQRALQTLYGRTHRLVFTLMMRITQRRETAEELTVDVFHDVWRRAGTYDPAAGPVIGWIANQARSRALDRLRFEHRQKRAGAETTAPDLLPAAVDDASQAQDQGRVLREALAGLTVDERCAIETAFFGGLSYREVAERLQEPLGTIKTRIRSALAKLRGALAPRQEDL